MYQIFRNDECLVENKKVLLYKGFYLTLEL